MTKNELVKVMANQKGSYFITKKELATFVGVKRSETISKYVNDLPVFNKKYYFIPDVAEEMVKDIK